MSNSGFAGIREAAADIAARRKGAGGGGDRAQFFKLDDGKEATVRFLEQGDDVAWSYAHQLDPVGNQRFGDWTPCLNTNNDGTPCPGCEQRRPRKVRGYINMIWRDGPIFEREEFKRDDGSTGTRMKRDLEGNVIVSGTGPMIATWAAGITVFEELDGLDATYKGLMTRDFQIKRKGTGWDTTYSIYPLDAEPMSEADKALMAEKPDLKPYVTPVAYEQWGSTAESAPQSSSQSAADTVNPFLKSK